MLQVAFVQDFVKATRNVTNRDTSFQRAAAWRPGVWSHQLFNADNAQSRAARGDTCDPASEMAKCPRIPMSVSHGVSCSSPSPPPIYLLSCGWAAWGPKATDPRGMSHIVPVILSTGMQLQLNLSLISQKDMELPHFLLNTCWSEVKSLLKKYAQWPPGNLPIFQ